MVSKDLAGMTGTVAAASKAAVLSPAEEGSRALLATAGRRANSQADQV